MDDLCDARAGKLLPGAFGAASYGMTVLQDG